MRFSDTKQRPGAVERLLARSSLLPPAWRVPWCVKDQPQMCGSGRTCLREGADQEPTGQRKTLRVVKQCNTVWHGAFSFWAVSS